MMERYQWFNFINGGTLSVVYHYQWLTLSMVNIISGLPLSMVYPYQWFTIING